MTPTATGKAGPSCYATVHQALVAAIDESGWKRTALAAHLGIGSPRLTALLVPVDHPDHRPWTVPRILKLPAAVATAFALKAIVLAGQVKVQTLLSVAASALEAEADEAVPVQQILPMMGLVSGRPVRRATDWTRTAKRAEVATSALVNPALPTRTGANG